MNKHHPRRRAWQPAVLAMVSWAFLAASYHWVLPTFGVLSPVTWTLTWLGWFGAIMSPVYGVIRTARSRRFAAATMWSVCAVLAVAVLAAFGTPLRTVDDLYQRHRAALDQLAAEYRAEGIGDHRALPLSLRYLAVDGRAHVRCTSRGPDRGCGVLLLVWQDWRGESGVGLAYFPVQPDADVAIATTAGDSGVPTRELGQGWWLVE